MGNSTTLIKEQTNETNLERFCICPRADGDCLVDHIDNRGDDMSYHISVRVIPSQQRWRSDAFTDAIIADLAFKVMCDRFRDATMPPEDIEIEVMLVSNGTIMKMEIIKRNGKETEQRNAK